MTEKEKFLKDITILVDTREQKNSHIIEYLNKFNINHAPTKLDFADYSFMVGNTDFRNSCVIERKASVNEIWSNITKERERFEKELATSKAQVMLFLIGQGGEGKSVIADILKALIGDKNVNDDKIHELQSNRFKVANCENKLLNIDDDLNFRGLEDTGLIKSVITGGAISVEQKGKQAYKINPYCRLLAFGNGSLNSLYDHSDGFYRRQIIINTKPKNKNRIDNPFLSDDIIDNELEGVFLWCLEGLNRLLTNNFKIFISQASIKALEDVKHDAFNFIDYLEDENEVQYMEYAEETSIDIYNSYCTWCYSNALKPLKSRSVLTYLKEHSGEYGIQPSNHIIKNGKQSRGFKGIKVTKYNQSVMI